MAAQDSQIPRTHYSYFSYTAHLNIPSLFFLILIFVALLLLAFFSCYFHSRYCYRHLSPTANDNNNNINTTSSLHRQANSAGLDSDTINSFQVVVRSALSDELGDLNGYGVMQTECSICLDGFEVEEMIKVLPKCNHAYHSECIDKWLIDNSSCPLCRESLLAQLPQDEVAITITEV